MKRNLFTLVLTFAIVLAPIGPAVQAQSKLTPKAEVEKRLVKKETHVKVKLHNGSEVRGRITQSSESGFTLTEDKTGNHKDIAYADVQHVEGRGWSKKKKVLVITAVVTGVAITALIIGLSRGLGNFSLAGINISER